MPPKTPLGIVRKQLTRARDGRISIHKDDERRAGLKPRTKSEIKRQKKEEKELNDLVNDKDYIKNLI